eukprot:429711-Prymnesium_polylepis.1
MVASAASMHVRHGAGALVGGEAIEVGRLVRVEKEPPFCAGELHEDVVVAVVVGWREGIAALQRVRCESKHRLAAHVLADTRTWGSPRGVRSFAELHGGLSLTDTRSPACSNSPHSAAPTSCATRFQSQPSAMGRANGSRGCVHTTCSLSASALIGAKPAGIDLFAFCAARWMAATGGIRVSSEAPSVHHSQGLAQVRKCGAGELERGLP